MKKKLYFFVSFDKFVFLEKSQNLTENKYYLRNLQENSVHFHFKSSAPTTREQITESEKRNSNHCEYGVYIKLKISKLYKILLLNY